jgi:hypothetical protein
MKTKILQMLVGAIFGIMIGLGGLFYDGLLLIGMFLIVVMIIFAVFLHIIIHEGGHLIFGLLSGYGFVSFRVLSFQLSKTPERYKIVRFKLAGTGGQCTLNPPGELGDDYPYKLYLAGGVIFNFCFSLISLIMYFFVSNQYLELFLKISFFVGIYLGISNLIPISEPIQNDGYNLFKMSDEDKKYLWVQLKVNALDIAGVGLCDMNQKFFEYNVPISSSMEAHIGLLVINRAECKKDFDQIEKASNDILNSDARIMKLIKDLCRISLLYKKIIEDEDIENLYKETRAIRKSMSKYPSVLRCEYAYELIVNKDESKGAVIKELFYKVMETYPSKTMVEYENELIMLVDKKMNQ